MTDVVNPYPDNRNAVTQCYEAARDARHPFFGLQNGGWCMASADAGRTYNQYGPSTACLMHGAGGPEANEVYTIVPRGKPTKKLHILLQRDISKSLE